MQIELHGKTALVTGSTSGIGYAIAKAMRQAGASVVVHGANPEHVKSACARLAGEVPGGEISGQVADLSDPEAVKKLLAEIKDVDVLVNNAGEIRAQRFFEITDEQWRRYSDTYILGAVRLARHYLPTMIQRGWGRILFSAGTTCSFTPGSPEGASRMIPWITCKAALLGMARGLAEIAAGTNVTVNSFIPGPSPSREQLMTHGVTGPTKTFEDFEAEFFAGPGESSILRRFLLPSEIANLVVFLASDQGSGITGSALRVDGGIIRPII